jgi:general stress protein 26
MTHDEARQAGLDLIIRTATLMVGSIDNSGYPNIKALFKMEHQGLDIFWFGTNTSSIHLQQIKSNPKTCVYAVDSKMFMGLTLLGDMEILHDTQSKQRLWRDGFEQYYLKGVTDPDYSVMRFQAREGRYYHGLQKVTFAIGKETS